MKPQKENDFSRNFGFLIVLITSLAMMVLVGYIFYLIGNEDKLGYEQGYINGTIDAYNNITFLNETFVRGYYSGSLTAYKDIQEQLGNCREIRCPQPNPYVYTMQMCMECIK